MIKQRLIMCMALLVIGLGAVQAQTSVAITTGTPYSANLRPGTTDLYTVTLSSPARLNVFTRNLDSWVSISTGPGAPFAAGYAGYAGHEAGFGINVPAGTHVIRVEGSDDAASGPYTLNVNAQPFQPVTPGTPYSANMQQGATHRYIVTVSRAGQLTAYTEGQIDLGIWIWDLALWDHTANGGSSANVSAGTYVIEVQGYTNDDGPYTLHVIATEGQSGTGATLSGMVGIDTYYAEKNSETSDKFQPAIILHPDGTFSFYVNLYAGTGLIHGTYYRSDNLYTFNVIDRDFSKGFLGADVDIFYMAINGDILIYQGDEIGMTKSGALLYKTTDLPLIIQNSVRPY